MQPDVTIAVLSCVEPPLPECLKAVEAQIGGPYRVVHVKDCFPMSHAFNEFVRLSAPSKYVVQVDGDVVLHVGAVETLAHSIRQRPLAYMCWGQLDEDQFGLGGSIRIWRRWPLRVFRFRDRRCVDRDLHGRIRWTGMYRHQVKWSDAPELPFGTHYPRQSEFARFSKSRGDTMKWRYLNRWDLIELHKDKYPNGIESFGRWSGMVPPLSHLNKSKNASIDYELFQDLRNRMP